MDLKDNLCQQDTWTSSSSGNKKQKKDPPDQQSFTNFSFQHQHKWEDPSILDYNTRIEAHFPEFKQIFKTPSSITRNQRNQTQIPNQHDDQMVDQTNDGSRTHDWDPKEMLNNLTFLEQKIHQLQNLVHLIVGRRGQIVGPADQLVAQQQQLITADLTSIIVQLISTAGNLLPSVKNSLLSMNSSLGQLGGIVFPSGMALDENRVSDQSKTEQNFAFEEHDPKDEEDGDEGENLLPGSYEILQLEREEILAPHTHFCTICGKGFKRDANLRMHMRGHGDEYKTPAALAKPNKESTSEPMLIKRYSCPYTGCKRNKDHKKFQPLKTILCVKNHYKRTHCDKSYTCSRCNTKKFSVIADLKTHEKHCGKDKWLCSCGTTFSRKDKLFGHIGLFQGHTPAIPLEEAKGSFVGPSDDPSGSGVQNDMDLKDNVDDPTGYFSSLNFDTSNISGFHEFPRPMFDDSEGSFSFLISGTSSHHRKPGGDSGSKDL